MLRLTTAGDSALSRDSHPCETSLQRCYDCEAAAQNCFRRGPATMLRPTAAGDLAWTPERAHLTLDYRYNDAVAPKSSRCLQPR